MRRFDHRVSRAMGISAAALGGLLLANCSQTASNKLTSRVDPKYGVTASPRVIQPGQPVPKGGGAYRVGKPYVVGGRTYVPSENKRYRHEGIASWYGDDFHGRLTANGEIYDMEGISAAHPTLPMPSYARVTNLRNGRSLIVRVNDRGPFHQTREIDLSAKAAHLLEFRGKGLARVRVEYVGPAAIEGSDDRKLIATLREGTPAPAPRMMASASPPPSAPVRARPYVAERTESEDRQLAPRRVATRDIAAERAYEPEQPARRAQPAMVQSRPEPRRMAAAEPAYEPVSRRNAWREPAVEREELPATVATVPSRRSGAVASRPLPAPVYHAYPDAPRATRERGSAEQPRLVWQTGPAPARVESASSYARPQEPAMQQGRGLY